MSACRAFTVVSVVTDYVLLLPFGSPCKWQFQSARHSRRKQDSILPPSIAPVGAVTIRAMPEPALIEDRDRFNGQLGSKPSPLLAINWLGRFVQVLVPADIAGKV